MMNKFAPNKTFSFTEGDVKPISFIKLKNKLIQLKNI